MGRVNRERCQSHTVVWRGRAAHPRVSQYPAELQYKDSPQPRDQPAGCPSPASHRQSLGVTGLVMGTNPVSLPYSSLSGCPWGSSLPCWKAVKSCQLPCLTSFY